MTEVRHAEATDSQVGPGATTRTGVRRIGAVVGIALAASAAGGATAQAGTDGWTPLAQPPQMVPAVTSISFGPGGVGYASGGERAFRTTDGGATWTVGARAWAR